MKLSTLTLTIAALVGFQAADAPAQGTSFKVRIENVSTGSTLKLSDGSTAPAPTSPGIWATYRGKNPVFAVGELAAGNGLERLAEEGNPDPLAAFFAANKKKVISTGVFKVPVGDSEAGPLLPGKSYEFTVNAEPGTKFLLAFMFGQSNDLFYAPTDGIELFDKSGKPITRELSVDLVLWDAGTEVNQEPGLGADQAPRQTAPDTGTAERKKILAVQDAFKYPAVEQVVRVTINSTRVAQAN